MLGGCYERFYCTLVSVLVLLHVTVILCALNSGGKILKMLFFPYCNEL